MSTMDNAQKLDLIIKKLDELVAKLDAPKPAVAPAGTVFPNYGKSKGLPIAGAPRDALEYYAGGCRRTLGDDSKSQWHEKERKLLAAIEAELARQEVTAPGDIPF